MFCIKPSDMELLPFMNMAFFYDCTGNLLNAKTGLHVEDPYSNAHYFDEIRHIVMHTTLMKSAIFIVTYILM